MLAKLAAATLTATMAATIGLAAMAAAAAPAAGCRPGTAGPVAGLDGEQAGNARLIVAVGQQETVPDRGLLVALMTAMQESGLRNLDYGDRDSLGLFQQRPSAGWGTPAQIRDPAYAAAAFYGGPHTPAANPGLLDIPGWPMMPPAAAAQAVQHSATPDADARWEDSARGWLASILDQPTTPGSPCPAGPPAATVAIAAATRWLGTPYAWGGGNLAGPTRGVAQGAGTVGFDCSGLTRYAWAQAGILLPRIASDQYHAAGRHIPTVSQLQPGDLVFFATDLADPATIHHVAIWLGADAMIEAPHTGDVVRITSGIAANPYWRAQFIGGLRLTG